MPHAASIQSNEPFESYSYDLPNQDVIARNNNPESNFFTYDFFPRIEEEIESDKITQSKKNNTIKGSLQSSTNNPQVLQPHLAVYLNEELPTLAYRQIKREPIFQDLIQLLNSLINSVGQIDAAVYYSQIKDRISQLWNFTDYTELLAQGLSTVDSATQYTKWKDVNRGQAHALLSSVKMLSDENPSQNLIDKITLTLESSGLNLFPYDEEDENS